MDRVSAKVGRFRRKSALQKYAAEAAAKGEPMCHAGFLCPKCKGNDTGTSAIASSTGRAEFICRGCGHFWSRPLPASSSNSFLARLAKVL